MAQKRMRIFAGPNGSGKTTIIQKLKAEFKFGVYVNADDLEKTLKTGHRLNFGDYKLEVESTELQDFFRSSTLTPVKHDNPDFWKGVSVHNNQLVLSVDSPVDSYLAADLAEFIRRQLLKEGHSFTYETVMSHPAKIDFLSEAKQAGYRVYLYYIATEDPAINISRVDLRVTQAGHSVSAEAIRNRYYRSLENLKRAVQATDRAYIFDNSGEASYLVAEITDGREVYLPDPEKAPAWFHKYLAD